MSGRRLLDWGALAVLQDFQSQSARAEEIFVSHSPMKWETDLPPSRAAFPSKENRNMMKTLFIALLVVCASSISYGTVFFQNDGTKEPWPNFPQTPQAIGTISDVTSPTFQGPSAIKFTQTWIPNYTGRYH